MHSYMFYWTMYDYYTDSDINWKIFIVYSVLGMGLGIWVHDARTQRTRCARGELSNDWRQSENEIGKRSSQNSRTVPVIPFRIPIAPLPGQYPIGGNLRFLIFRASGRGVCPETAPGNVRCEKVTWLCMPAITCCAKFLFWHKGQITIYHHLNGIKAKHLQRKYLHSRMMSFVIHSFKDWLKIETTFVDPFLTMTRNGFTFSQHPTVY